MNGSAELATGGPISGIRARVLPLPVLLDVERDGDRVTLLVTLDGAISRVMENGGLDRWPGGLDPDELVTAKERLRRAALERMSTWP